MSAPSLLTAVLTTHTALYQPPMLCLLLSPSLRQSQELFRKVLDTVRALDSPVPIEEESGVRRSGQWRRQSQLQRRQYLGDLGRQDLGTIADLALGIDGVNLYAASDQGLWRLNLMEAPQPRPPAQVPGR